MRFRKRVKIFPGFSLNFSNSGISSSIGVRGASITFGKKGTYLNTSIPGTGLYNRQKIGGTDSFNSLSNDTSIPKQEETIILPDRPGAIKSADPNEIISSDLAEVKETLREAFEDRIQIKEEMAKTQADLKTAKTIKLISSLLIIGLVIKYFKEKVQEKEEYIKDLEIQYTNSKVDIDIIFDSEFKSNYELIEESFKDITKSEMIWDVTSSVKTDSIADRSGASASITRRKVNFKFDSIEIIKSTYNAIHLENANGGDLFIYPGFVIITKNKKDFGLINIGELELKFITVQFIEQEKIPNDSVKIGETWAKVNKNGQPDKRFKDNYKIPIVKYGQIELRSKTGLNESYCLSNHDKTERFVKAFIDYQKNILK